MSDVKAKVKAVVVPVGMKVRDADGNEIGEVTDWTQTEDGMIEVQAALTDPRTIDKILNGSQGSFSLSSKVVLDD